MENIKEQILKVTQQIRDTKQGACNYVTQKRDMVYEQKANLISRYNERMDPATREDRDLAVFLSTCTVGFLTLAFTKRPRILLRNTIYTYILTSIAI